MRFAKKLAKDIDEKEVNAVHGILPRRRQRVSSRKRRLQRSSFNFPNFRITDIILFNSAAFLKVATRGITASAHHAPSTRRLAHSIGFQMFHGSLSTAAGKLACSKGRHEPPGQEQTLQSTLNRWPSWFEKILKIRSFISRQFPNKFWPNLFGLSRACHPKLLLFSKTVTAWRAVLHQDAFRFSSSI